MSAKSAPPEGDLGDLAGKTPPSVPPKTPAAKAAEVKAAADKAAADKLAADAKVAAAKVAADLKLAADKKAADDLIARAADEKAQDEKLAADAKAAADKKAADDARNVSPVDEELAPPGGGKKATPVDPPKKNDFSLGSIFAFCLVVLLLALVVYLALNREKASSSANQAGLGGDPVPGKTNPEPAPVAPATPPVPGAPPVTPAPTTPPIPGPIPPPDLSGTDVDLALRVDDLQNQLNVDPAKLEAMRKSVAAARAGATALVVAPDSCASNPNQPQCSGAVMKEDYDYLHAPGKHPRDIEFEMKAFGQVRTP